MRKAVVIGVVALAAIGCLLTSTRAGGGGVSYSSFSADFVVVSSKSDPKGRAILKEPREKRLGNSVFLVGEGAGYIQPNYWRNGKRVWIAIDDIAEIVEIDSPNDIQGPKPER